MDECSQLLSTASRKQLTIGRPESCRLPLSASRLDIVWNVVDGTRLFSAHADHFDSLSRRTLPNQFIADSTHRGYSNEDRAGHQWRPDVGARASSVSEHVVVGLINHKAYRFDHFGLMKRHAALCLHRVL